MVHPGQLQDAVRRKLDQAVEFIEQAHRQDVELAHRDHGGVDQREVGNLASNGAHVIDFGLHADEGKLGFLRHIEPGDRGKGDQPVALQPLDAAAHGAFGHAQFGGDLAVRYARIERQQIDELPVEII